MISASLFTYFCLVLSKAKQKPKLLHEEQIDSVGNW